MWALLAEPGHADSFSQLGEAYTPLRQLVEQLTRREYADRVYAFKALASFNLTTAPTHEQSPGHDGFGIEYDPERGAFRVGYDDRAPRMPGPRIRTPTRVCDSQEVGEVIDRNVQRLLLSRPQPAAEPSAAHSVILLTMFVGMGAFLLFWVLMWGGLPVGRFMLASMAVLAIATGLHLFGRALRPGWAEAQWHPRPGIRVVPPNRLTYVGAGIWFSAVGAVFLRGALLGDTELPKFAVWVFLGVMATGFVLVLVGAAIGRRRAEAAHAIQLALREYADRHDGWFPRGEASPEASLSLLYRENSKRITADVLRGRVVPWSAVEDRLAAGELLTPETCGWHYAEGLRRDDDPRLALFWEKSGPGQNGDSRSGGGHFVYFLGGGIEYIADERWGEFLAEQERARAAVQR